MLQQALDLVLRLNTQLELFVNKTLALDSKEL